MESATLAFVVIGSLLHAWMSRDGGRERHASDAFRGEWALWCIGALALYWSSLQVGLLSDDFVLVDRAWRGEFGPVHAQFVRPLPLFAWGALLRLHGGAVALHAANILGHGMVAFVASRLAAGFVPSRPLARGAGLLVLGFPAAVEAVTWASGIFDITATLLALTAVLVSRRYAERSDLRSRAALFACSIGALLCKETAVVTPALVAVVAWAERRVSRRLLFDLAAVTALVATVGVVRLTFASDVIGQPITRYLVQRWLFSTVGGLAVPWHGEVVTASPILPIAAALLTITLATTFFVTPAPAGDLRVAAAAACWILLGTLPTATFLGIGRDLQGARYLYLPSVGYALLLVVMARDQHDARRRLVGAAAIAALVLFGAAGTLWHQRPWLAAAAARDTILASARTNERLRACGQVTLRNLPDNVDGAYLFRNGAELAFAEVGLSLSANAPPACVFRWDAGSGAFTTGSPAGH